MIAAVIIVTGSRRSGTSMWMQVLAAVGLPIIGDRFPLDWGDALAAVNPHGFYESTLRDGIHHGTNPDPRSGEYLHPDETRMHAVKVFPEGVVRSDLSFLDRVLVTIRPWYEYVASMERLFDVENEARGWSDADRPPRLRPEVEWWTANFSLVRDVAMRRYRVHLQTYAEMLARPHEIVPRVLAWIADGTDVGDGLDLDAGVAAVQAATSTCTDARRPAIDPRHAEIFDAFYEAVAAGRGLDTALLSRMNDLQRELEPMLSEHARAVLRWVAERPDGAASATPLALGKDPETGRGGFTGE